MISFFPVRGIPNTGPWPVFCCPFALSLISHRSARPVSSPLSLTSDLYSRFLMCYEFLVSNREQRVQL